MTESDAALKPAGLVPCNGCGKKTHHVYLAAAEISGEDQQDETWWFVHYEVLRCGGCQQISFRKRFVFSEWQSFAPNEPVVSEDTYYPPRESRKRPEWMRMLPEGLQEVLGEVYAALQNGSRFLAAVGARTALDIVLVDKVGDKGTFKAKLRALQDAGHVSNHEREMLEILTDAGNASAHRGFRPEEADLITVMDILEGVLEKLYVAPARQQDLAKRANELKGKVPGRRP